MRLCDGFCSPCDAYLWVSLNLKPSTTQVAFTTERVNGRAVIAADLLLLSVVPDAHADVIITCSAGVRALKVNPT